MKNNTQPIQQESNVERSRAPRSDEDTVGSTTEREMKKDPLYRYLMDKVDNMIASNEVDHHGHYHGNSYYN